MGVWIETKSIIVILFWFRVTPRVGVWIETNYGKYPTNGFTSLPVWECGLKLKRPTFTNMLLVTPRVGVWIETSETP